MIDLGAYPIAKETGKGQNEGFVITECDNISMSHPECTGSFGIPYRLVEMCSSGEWKDCNNAEQCILRVASISDRWKINLSLPMKAKARPFDSVHHIATTQPDPVHGPGIGVADY